MIELEKKDKEYVDGRALDGTPVRYPVRVIFEVLELERQRKLERERRLHDEYTGLTPMEDFDF